MKKKAREMATVDKEKTAAEATALFDQGIAKIKANEMDNAIGLLGKCLELRTAAFGENAIETAQAYHKYGCALFYKAQDENTVFGARAQEAADAKKEADAANDASDEGEDVGDDDADDASAENADAPATDDADPEEGEKEEGAQQDDMELAWEMIECARLIYETEMDDLDGDTSGGHPIDLANVYEILGDINTEASNFKESLDDYSKCLALLEAHVDEDDRRIAGVLCSISVCHQFDSEPDAALKCVTRAIGILNARLKRLKSSDENAIAAVEAAPLPAGAKRHADPLAVAKAELETIEATIGDLAAREEELRSVCSEDDATREQIKKAFAAIGGGAPGGEAAAVKANADGSVETIGFDAPKTSNAPVTNLGVVGGGKKGAPKRIVMQPAAAAAPAPEGSANAAAAAAFAAMSNAPAAPAAPRRSLEDMMGPAGGESNEGFGAPKPAEAKKAKVEVAPVVAAAPVAEGAGGEKENAPNGCPQQ